MEKRIIWLINFALWLVMRLVFVTVPFKIAFGKVSATQNTSAKLELPAGDEDLSVAIAFAKEYCDDQDHSTGVILEKFKAIMGMYSFSVPILIGFLSSRMVMLPHWSVAIVGILVCIPGFCMMKYFSVKTYISKTLSQDDISKSFRQQQVDQINWYYSKGNFITTNNNHSVNIYYATQRWLWIALITLLTMAFYLKFPNTPQISPTVNNTFNNFATQQEAPKDAGKKKLKSATPPTPPMIGDGKLTAH